MMLAATAALVSVFTAPGAATLGATDTAHGALQLTQGLSLLLREVFEQHVLACDQRLHTATATTIP